MIRTKKRVALEASTCHFIIHSRDLDPVGVVAHLMRECGIDIMRSCGCRWGEAWGYMACSEHRGEWPKICFCTRCEELVGLTAASIRGGMVDTPDHWRQLRVEHYEECTKRKWREEHDGN